MIQPTFYNPTSLLATLITPNPPTPSRLGEILVAAHAQQMRTAPAWITPTNEIVDYLPVPEPLLYVALDELRQKRWVSAARVAHHQKKLLAEVAEFRLRDAARVKEASAFQRSAREYWKFCVAFEFPKVYDQAAMEAAATHLMLSLIHI